MVRRERVSVQARLHSSARLSCHSSSAARSSSPAGAGRLCLAAWLQPWGCEALPACAEGMSAHPCAWPAAHPNLQLGCPERQGFPAPQASHGITSLCAHGHVLAARRTTGRHTTPAIMAPAADGRVARALTPPAASTGPAWCQPSPLWCQLHCVMGRCCDPAASVGRQLCVCAPRVRMRPFQCCRRSLMWASLAALRPMLRMRCVVFRAIPGLLCRLLPAAHSPLSTCRAPGHHVVA